MNKYGIVFFVLLGIYVSIGIGMFIVDPVNCVKWATPVQICWMIAMLISYFVMIVYDKIKGK